MWECKTGHRQLAVVEDQGGRGGGSAGAGVRNTQDTDQRVVGTV